MELKAERVKQLSCAHCGASLDPAASKPLTMATCPSCGKKTLAPAVFGDYQLTGGLGKGTTGGVLRATDASGRSVAIKIMTAIAADAGRVTAALETARKLQSVDSPQIVKILATGDYRQQPYVAMELIQGTTLGKTLADSENGKWNELRSIRATAEIARGLAAAARAGVLHTDLNPQHILIDTEGNPRLIAFASAAFAGAADPHYAAPEIRMGEPATAQSDMYSLGAVMFQLLTGRAPTDEDRGEALAKTLVVMQQVTLDVVERLLALEPGDRPGSYDNLIKHLQAAEETIQEGGHGLPSLADVAEMMDKSPLLDEPAQRPATPVSDTAEKQEPVDAMAELSAISIQLERSEKSGSGSAIPMPKPQPKPRPETPMQADPGRKKILMIAGGVAAMLLIGAAAFFLSGKKQPAAPVTTTPPAPTTPAAPAAVPSVEPAATPVTIQTAANRFTRDPLWISLTPTEMKAANGATFTKLDDGSILVAGPHQPGESFQITATMPKGDKKITAIGIETLPHESLERGGPGRTGNFVLTTFSAAASGKEPAKVQPVAFSAAESDYEQTGSSAELALDSDPKTGWAISPRYGVSHWAIFWLREPAPNTNGTTFQFTLGHHPDYVGSIGRFRLWAMNEKPAPPPAPATPPPTIASAPKALAPVAPPKAPSTAPAAAATKALAPKAPATPPPIPAAPVFKPIYDAVTSMADRQTWYTADIIDAKSSGGAILTKQADGSVLASGKESEGDVYTVTLKTRVKNITGIRIDTIPDKSLLNQGPGRTGDFVLAKVTAGQAAKKEGPFTPVTLGEPAADVTTADFPPAHAIDEDPITGWAGGPEGVGKTHHIRFPVAEKFGAANENYFQITLAHHSKFALGRFLISVTSNAAPERLTTAPTAQLPTHVYSFITLKPKSAASANGADLTINADASVIASGKNAPGDSYEVTLETAIPNITAIQLETLTDDSLQKKGPGRLGGMFSIHTISAQIAPRATPDKKQPVVFEEVFADAAPKKGQEAANMIDDKPQTVWTNAGDVGEARKAVFLVKGAIGGAAGSVISLKIDQKVNLGKFRVSVITNRAKSYIADLAKPEPEGPELVELYFNIGGQSYTDDRKRIWKPAPQYTPGKTGYVSVNPLEPKTISKITNELHKSYLENLEGFKAAVPPGIYQVQLIFVEPVERQVSGFRQIEIYVEGKNMGRVINILQESGGFGKPAIKTLGPVAVTDGTLDIEFKGKGRILSGVAIIGKPAPAPARK